MPTVSVRADLMPKEICREVSRLEKLARSGIRLLIFLLGTHPWLVGWTSLGLGQLCPGVSGVHVSQTRPGPASALPPLSILTRAHFKGAVICKQR